MVSVCYVPSSCWTEALGGRHPRDLMAHGEQRQLVDAMAESVGRIAAAFTPRPVVYRATELSVATQFRGLRGGETYEPVEHDPMIGYRGVLPLRPGP